MTKKSFTSTIASGGGGTSFEFSVGAYYLNTLLWGIPPKGQPAGHQTTNVSFQRLHDNEPLDDIIVHTMVGNSPGKLSLQVKRQIVIGKKDAIFDAVMKGCWETFSKENFNRDTDRFGIVIGIYSKTIDEDYGPILEVARNKTDAKDFHKHLDTVTNKTQKGFVNLIREKLNKFNREAITDEILWQFMRHMVIWRFDFHIQTSSDADNLLDSVKTRLPKNGSLQAQDVVDRLFHYAAEGIPLAASYDRRSLINKLKNDGIDVKESTNLAKQFATLQRWQAESIERCINRWEALGVPYEQAKALTDDPKVGEPPQSILVNTAKLILLVGDFGVGKSLILERLYQNALSTYSRSTDAPLPLWLHARTLANKTLSTLTEELVADFEEPYNKEIVVFVDGTDEYSEFALDLTKIRSQARALINSTRNALVYIASRPTNIDSLSSNEKIEAIPGLQEEEIYALISKIAGKEIHPNSLWDYPELLKEAVKIPLFTILLGSYFRERDVSGKYLMTGELLADLVEKSLGKVTDKLSSAISLLQRLAVLTVKYDGPVKKEEIGSILELKPLIDSRLIVLKDGVLEFPTPILGQWFAAQELTKEDFDFDAAIADPTLLKLWLYPLTIFISTNSHERVSKIMKPLVEKHPSFASFIIDKSIKRNWSKPVSLPSPLECGKRIRETMNSWVTGIGILKTRVEPLKENGELRKLAIDISASNQPVTAWSYHNDDLMPDVVYTPGLVNSHDDSWRYTGSWPVADQPAWAWQYTHYSISYKIESLLKNGRLLKGNPTIIKEARWAFAQAVVDQMQRTENSRHNTLIMKSFSSKAIPLRILEKAEKIAWEEQQARFRQIDLQTHDEPKVFALKTEENPQAIQDFIALLKNERLNQVEPPWPLSDIAFKDGGHIGLLWSDKQILDYAQSVFSQAINILQNLLETWFTNFSSNPQNLFPVTIFGKVIPFRKETGRGPSIDWFVEPNESSQSNTVELVLGREYEFSDIYNEVRIDTALEKMSLIRKSNLGIGGLFDIGGQSQTLDITSYMPATHLAYKWLASSLHSLKWINSRSGLDYEFDKKQIDILRSLALEPIVDT